MGGGGWDLRLEFLKAPDVVALSLQFYNNTTWTLGAVPQDWQTEVVGLFRRGARRVGSNYRSLPGKVS